MDFYIIKSHFNKLKKTIFFNFLLIFLTAFITKNCILIFKKSLKIEEINSSFLLLNIDTSYRFFWFFSVIIIFYILSLIKFKLNWSIVSKEIKLIVMLSTIVLTWSTVFSDYNYYEDNWFFFDRILLLVMCILVYFKPSVIFLYILYFFVFIEQFDYFSFWGFSLTHTIVLIYILFLTWVYIILHKISNKKVNSNILFLMFLGMIMSWYFLAGISKLNYNWLNLNITYNLFAIRLDYGWLSFLNFQTIEKLGALVLKYNYQIQIITLIIELVLPLIIIINKRILIFCLISVIIFHLSVFALTGILFWQWIVIELLLIYINYRKSFTTSKPKYLFYCYYLFVLLIAKDYLGVIQLGWLDSTVVHKHKFILENKDGLKTNLNSTFFAPFHTSFSKDKFYFLDSTKIVSGTFGGIYRKNLIPLNNQNNKDSIFNRINKVGNINFNNKKKQEFIKFLKTFIDNKKTIKYSLPIKPIPDILEAKNLNTFKVSNDIVYLLIVNETKKVDIINNSIMTIVSDTIVINLK